LDTFLYIIYLSISNGELTVTEAVLLAPLNIRLADIFSAILLVLNSREVVSLSEVLETDTSAVMLLMLKDMSKMNPSEPQTNSIEKVLFVQIKVLRELFI